jgi:hypothetical protein
MRCAVRRGNIDRVASPFDLRYFDNLISCTSTYFRGIFRTNVVVVW